MQNLVYITPHNIEKLCGTHWFIHCTSTTVLYEDCNMQDNYVYKCDKPALVGKVKRAMTKEVHATQIKQYHAHNMLLYPESYWQCLYSSPFFYISSSIMEMVSVSSVTCSLSCSSSWCGFHYRCYAKLLGLSFSGFWITLITLQNIISIYALCSYRCTGTTGGCTNAA